MFNYRKILYAIFFVFLLTGCSTMAVSGPSGTNTGAPTPTVIQREWKFTQDIRARGKVVLVDQINLSFPISGHVLELLVTEGEFVQQGDEIARIDTTNLMAEASTAEGELIVAQKNLQRVMAGPHESQIVEAEIQVTAVASRGSVTMAQATQQASDLAAAQAQLDYLLAQPLPEDVAVAQAEVNRARYNVEAARSLLAQASLVAPMDGTVTEVFINVYEYAYSGQSVVQISDLTELNVEVEMDDLEIANVDIGDTLFVTFEALSGIEVEGKVVSIKPNEARNSDRDFIVLIELSEYPEGLRWGMTAEVTIPKQ
jgi:HlyD family secretion protein